MQQFYTLKWEGTAVSLLDQRRLPKEIVYETLRTVEDAFEAIRVMKVRGAPAIGVAAGYGMVLGLDTLEAVSGDDFLAAYTKMGEYMKTARPTAVNLMWAIDKMLAAAKQVKDEVPAERRAALEKEAVAIEKEDADTNYAIGENLLKLIPDGSTVLTHCNAGILATTAYGTALSVFYVAQEKGMNIKAYADETRPRLQGANLTAFELHNRGIDTTLICDNMAAVVMSQKKIDAIVVGCDRVAANGDTANKIGTFNVSILAKYFDIPMYIAAPTSTIDMNCPTGADIPIEERPANEIIMVNDKPIAPVDIKTYNPAFDVSPAENLAAIVTEKGIARYPYTESLKELMKK